MELRKKIIANNILLSLVKESKNSKKLKINAEETVYILFSFLRSTTKFKGVTNYRR